MREKSMKGLSSAANFAKGMMSSKGSKGSSSSSGNDTELAGQVNQLVASLKNIFETSDNKVKWKTVIDEFEKILTTTDKLSQRGGNLENYREVLDNQFAKLSISLIDHFRNNPNLSKKDIKPIISSIYKINKLINFT